MTIRVVYSEEPNFPAADQHPDAVRYQVGGYVVDAIGAEPSIEEVEAFLNPVIVPASVTMRQARIALLRAGLLPQVDAAIAAMPAQAGGDEARITWNYGAEVQRAGPLIGQLAPGLGLTDKQIDALFIEAATL